MSIVRDLDEAYDDNNTSIQHFNNLSIFKHLQPAVLRNFGHEKKQTYTKTIPTMLQTNWGT